MTEQVFVGMDISEAAELIFTQGIQLGHIHSVAELTNVDVLSGSTLAFEIEPDCPRERNSFLNLAVNVFTFSNAALAGDLVHAGIRHLAIRIHGESSYDFEMISSMNAIDAVAQGDSLTWMNGSQIIDNTSSQVQGRGHHLIHDMESTMRQLIVSVLSSAFGDNFWENATQNVNVNRMPSSSQSLADRQKIEHTYLYHLRDIILENWSIFENTFQSRDVIESWYIQLNPIRRDMAHSRQLSVEQINQLSDIQRSLYDKIGRTHPHLIEDFLLEAWKSEYNNLVNYINDHIAPMNNRMTKLMSMNKQREATLLGVEIKTAHANVYRQYSQKLSSYPRVAGFTAIQDKIEELLNRRADSMECLASIARSALEGDFNSNELERAAEADAALDNEWRQLVSHVIFS